MAGCGEREFLLLEGFMPTVITPIALADFSRLLYAMGNLALACDSTTGCLLSEANKRYMHAYNICSQLGPTQILISSIHFKLGVTATKSADFDEA
jgi:hypothetical protein